MAGLLEIIRTTQQPRVNAYTEELLERAAARHGEDSGAYRGIYNQYFRMPTAQPGIARSTRHYDAFGELPVGVERLYRRVLVVDLLLACASECVFCIRGLYDRHTLNDDDMSAIVAYVAQDPHLTEVLVTGGDPLIAPNKLSALIAKISTSAPNIRVVRIGTRLPVQSPLAFTEETYAPFTEHADRLSFEIGLQVNHPFELQPEAADVLRRLDRCGVRVYSQNVLLRDVNDDVATLVELYDRLRALNVIPHYLFHAVPMVGTDEFRTSVAKGVRLIKEVTASGYLSGMAKPAYTLMTDVGKVTLYEGTLQSRKGRMLTVRTSYQLGDRLEWNPGYRLPESATVNELGTLDVEYIDGGDSDDC